MCWVNVWALSYPIPRILGCKYENHILQVLLKSFLTCCVEFFRLHLLPIEICFSISAEVLKIFLLTHRWWCLVPSDPKCRISWEEKDTALIGLSFKQTNLVADYGTCRQRLTLFNTQVDIYSPRGLSDQQLRYSSELTAPTPPATWNRCWTWT